MSLCRFFFKTARRRTIGVAILSLIIYTSFISMACDFSLQADQHYNRDREELGHSNTTQSHVRLQQFDLAKDEQLSYLFWTWMAILFGLTFGIDALLLLPAAIFKSRQLNRLYLAMMSLMCALNFTPLMFVLDIDTNGKSEGKFNIFWFGWLTALIFIHRIFNSVIVWFLLTEIERHAGDAEDEEWPDDHGHDHKRRRSTTSTATQMSVKSSSRQINPLTPPISGSLHHPFQLDLEEGDKGVKEEGGGTTGRNSRQSQSQV